LIIFIFATGQPQGRATKNSLIRPNEHLLPEKEKENPPLLFRERAGVRVKF